MAVIRKAGWFLGLAFLMAGVMGVLGSVRGVAMAGAIPSHAGEAGSVREAEIAKVQQFLERKVVLQKLVDYGVSPQDAMAKIRTMSDSDLHRLASLTEKAAAGADSALGVLIAIAVLVILVIIIMKLLNKEIVVR